MAGCNTESKPEEGDFILSEMKDENTVMLIEQVCGTAGAYYRTCQDG